MSYRLGVDVGGTFTDLVLVSPDGVARIEPSPEGVPECPVVSQNRAGVVKLVRGGDSENLAGRMAEMLEIPLLALLPPWLGRRIRVGASVHDAGDPLTEARSDRLERSRHP